MDPAHMEWMASEPPNGSYLFCPNGSHCAFHDDREIYTAGLTDFILDVDGAEGYRAAFSTFDRANVERLPG